MAEAIRTVTRRLARVTLVLLAALTAPAGTGDEPPEEAEPIFPQRLSAGELLGYCASSAMTHLGRERRGYCAGFISGVEEATRLAGGEGAERRICAAPDLTARSLADAYIRYATRHPEALSQPAAAVVLEALSLAYPCDGPLRR